MKSIRNLAITGLTALALAGCGKEEPSQLEPIQCPTLGSEYITLIKIERDYDGDGLKDADVTLRKGHWSDKVEKVTLYAQRWNDGQIVYVRDDAKDDAIRNKYSDRVPGSTFIK